MSFANMVVWDHLLAIHSRDPRPKCTCTWTHTRTVTQHNTPNSLPSFWLLFFFSSLLLPFVLGEAKESRSKRKGKKKGKRGETGSIRPRLKVSEKCQKDFSVWFLLNKELQLHWGLYINSLRPPLNLKEHGQRPRRSEFMVMECRAGGAGLLFSPLTLCWERHECDWDSCRDNEDRKRRNEEVFDTLKWSSTFPNMQQIWLLHLQSIWVVCFWLPLANSVLSFYYHVT